jgi:hypothetical protein
MLNSFEFLPDDYAKSILAALACSRETRPDWEKAVSNIKMAWRIMVVWQTKAIFRSIEME